MATVATNETKRRRRVAAVTGAGSGVGQAIVLQLAERGWDLALIGRRIDPLEDTQSRLSESCTAISFECDISDEMQVERTFDRINEQFGPLDGLVLAAGVGLYGPVESYPLSDWNQTIGTNLTGNFLCVRASIPLLRNGIDSSIVAISSGAAKQGYGNLVAYSASKFGLMGLMQSLAEELKPDGIRVGSVVPGSIITEFAGGSLEDKRRSQNEGKRFLEADDVACQVVNMLELPSHAWIQEIDLWPY